MKLTEIRELTASTHGNAKAFIVKMNDKGCWECVSHYRNKLGYIHIMRNGELTLGHRFAYKTLVGDIPKGLHVLHKCDNPPCINPKHLFLGTDADNSRDKIKKGRMGDRKGIANANAKLTEKDVKRIRALRGTMSQRAIAKEYNISKSHVFYVQCIGWKQV